MTDLVELQKFSDPEYREVYLDSHVKGSIAYQVKGLREKTGRNQTDFGALIGMPQSVVSRLENAEGGSVNISTLLKVANRLGIALSIRFCGVDVMLDEDVSPQALSVETIQETIERLKKATALDVGIVPAIVGTEATKESVQGIGSWPKIQIPNQQQVPILLGAGTNTSARYMPTPASQAWVHTMSR